MQNIVVHEYHGYTDHFEGMFIGLVFTYVFTYDFHLRILLFILHFSAATISLTQTHPAAPYVCRTGNITLRCQYDGVEGVSSVVWLIGLQATANPSTTPGHTALPRTTTYQEVVVDSYTNLRERYQCTPVLIFGAVLNSNVYLPQIERT